MKYVVKSTIRRVGVAELIDEESYLIAINYNPYNKVRDSYEPPVFGTAEEAFEFSTLAAAEMAAVWVGGNVEEMP